MTILYFTATGNGLYLSKRIGGKLVSIPKAIKEGIYNFKDDKIGIIFPVYGWAVPQYIRDFLKRVQLESEYIFAIMSYGKIAGSPISHLQSIASENGIHFSYINIIKMIDNYLPVFDMKKELKSEPNKQIEKHLNLIIDNISNNKQWLASDQFMSKLITKLYWLKVDPYKTGIGITNKFRIENSCAKCGVCAKVCPTDNIQAESATPTFSNQCITCLACTHNCPKKAIRLSSEKSKERFRNRHISLDEIIESNN